MSILGYLPAVHLNNITNIFLRSVVCCLPVEGSVVVEPLHHERVLLLPGEGVGEVEGEGLAVVVSDGGGEERGDHHGGDPHTPH